MSKNLTQLGHQLAEIWRQLGLNQRITVVGAALLVMGGLLGLVFWSNRADFELLYGGLDEASAGKVLKALDEAKVQYQVSKGGGSIYVPSDKKYGIRMQLASQGIPRGEGVGFEIFDKPNFGLSDFVQRANFVRAVQGELARSISQLDAVETARVFIVMPENRLLTESQKRPTASVLVRLRGQSQLPAQAINSIRFLVANAVEGLDANHVAVLDNRGTVLSENTESDSLAGLSATQLVARRNLEQYLSKKAEDMLQMVLGSGQAVVRVAADINFDTINRKETKFDGDNVVPRTSTTEDDNSLTTSTGSGGLTGISANANTETNTTAGMPSNNTTTKKKTTTVENAINESTSSILQSAGGLKRLTAAVFVAAKMEGTGADRKIVPRTEDELKRLRNIVQSALGLQLTPDGTRSDELNLEEMAFNDQVNTDLTQQLDKQQKYEFVWNLVKNLIYPALALVMLGFFWKTFKSTPAENIPIGIPLGQFAGNGHGNGNGHRPGNGHLVPDWTKSAEPGVVTVDVLNRLVRENPDNMSQAIRSWLTRGKSGPSK